MDNITMQEKQHLRELAKKMLEYSQLPVMNERKNAWYVLNDCKPSAYPIVIMQIGGFKDEFYPKPKCRSRLGKAIESFLVQHIMHHEIVDDDTVIPDFYPVGIKKSFSFLSGALPEKRISSFAHVPEPAVEVDDFPDFVEKIGKSKWSVDKKATDEQFRAASDVLDGILDVRLWGGSNGFNPAGNLFKVLGMEGMFYALSDCPDAVHEFMQKLTDDYMMFLDECEKADAILPNSDNHSIPMATYGFTRDLPPAGNGGAVTLKDTWGYMNSQETQGISADMFHEFFFPYYNRFADRVGLLSYGCCEDPAGIWEKSVSRFGSLRKLSVSAFTASEEYMAEVLRGKKIVYHRKPSPNYLTSESGFDEQAFCEHIAASVKAARGLPLHFSFRDILTVRNDLSRVPKAVKLTRSMIEKYYK